MPLPEGVCERDVWEEYFAEAYHWTPDQVGRLPARFVDRAPLIREARARAADLRGKSAGTGPRL